jgi:uncharacterized membrane protein YedE/YeeE
MKMKFLSYLTIGIVFGVGLILSGMTQPLKVLGFLDIFGNWDPTLAFVMGSAVITTTIGYKLILRRSSPVLENKFFLPTVSTLDTRLVLGASMFGIGWGLVGFCPGPALTAVSSLTTGTITFVCAMFAGFWLVGLAK